jgi:hypothetical protein
MVRWYDGSVWTEHAAPAGGPVPGDVYDGEKGASTARLAGFAFLVRGLVAAIQVSIAPVIFARFWDRFQRALDDPDGSGSFGGADFGLFSLASQAASLVAIACVVFLCLWTHRATKNARGLGLATTFSPGMAVAAWFIPLANFVLPYLVVRDLFPDGHPARRRVAIWWAVEIGALLVGFAAYATAVAAGTGAGVAIGLVAGALSLTAGVLGFRLTRSSADVHAGLAGSVGLR